MSEAIKVTFEPTPNPHSLRFQIDRKIADGTADFRDPKQVQRSPLARKIFGFPWADGVYIGPDFVTVTKQDWVDWDVLAEPLAGLIGEHIERGEAVLHPEAPAAPAENDTPETTLIKKIINEEIRPAVALDGGDIIFHKYQDHVVYLYMQGSCAGCPSSTYTLKAGIETRLKNALPEIQEVVAL